MPIKNSILNPFCINLQNAQNQNLNKFKATHADVAHFNKYTVKRPTRL